LNAHAAPYLVRADGTYQLIPGGDVAASLPRLHAHEAEDPLPSYNSRRVKVQLSHWNQLLALPHVGR
jgi:hypothetical protein